MIRFSLRVFLSTKQKAKKYLPKMANDKTSETTVDNTFYYFGYGSNMLEKRIKIQNPSARLIGKGILKDYRLDFHTLSEKWCGSPATIVPQKEAEVHGAIWEIDMKNLKDLDNQEGVEFGIYVPLTVDVVTYDCTGMKCRCYIMKNQPTTELASYAPNAIPCERQPSKTYLKTIVKGALQVGISDVYIDKLKSIKHNGNIIDDFEKLLELENFDV